MDRGRSNPLKADGKLLHPLQQILDGFKKWDKPTNKKLPVEVDVVELLCIMGHMGYATTKDAVLGDWALIAFYDLLHIGEYTQKGSRNESKQTVEFCMMDVIFFEFDSKGRLQQMPRDASDERVKKVAGAALRLSNQKNGWKNVCIFHFANGDDITCLVRALGQRYVHIRQHTNKKSISLSTYFVQGCKHNLKDTDIRTGLKYAAGECNYPSRGIPIERIDTHSLCGGGANALSLK